MILILISQLGKGNEKGLAGCGLAEVDRFHRHISNSYLVQCLLHFM